MSIQSQLHFVFGLFAFAASISVADIAAQAVTYQASEVAPIEAQLLCKGAEACSFYK